LELSRQAESCELGHSWIRQGDSALTTVAIAARNGDRCNGESQVRMVALLPEYLRPS